MNKIRVCMLTDAWWPVWGGGQEHTMQVASRLADKEVEITIVVPNLTARTQNAKLKTQNYNSKVKTIWLAPPFLLENIWGRVRFALEVLLFLLRSDFDVYHSHSFSTSIFLPLVKLRGKKTAITVHGIGVNLVGGGFLNKLGIPKFLLWLVLYVWPYDYKFSAGMLPGFVTVGNGVNISEYDAVKVKKDPQKFRIFWIGRRYDPIKGVKYLEEAVKEINNQKILLDIADNVYGEEKIKRFKRADLFVLPSLSEGLPITLLEAMAARLPVIVTDVGDCGTIVRKANCGTVVPPGDAEKLAETIGEMTSKTAKERGEIGDRGYRFVKEHYSWEKVAQKVYAGYQEIYAKM